MANKKKAEPEKAIIAEAEALGQPTVDLVETLGRRIKESLPSEHHNLVDEVIYITKPADEETEQNEE